MKREVDMNEISDGRLYRANDMVKADCGGCIGCCDCCKRMGKSIVLDPMDIYCLEQNLHLTFEQLLEEHIELNVVDSVILPNLKMAGEEERCTFLNEEGRCSVHPFRPGICRLFPLGRYYEEEGFSYFLQVHECPKAKSKIKVRKWLEIPDLASYEQYISRWHGLLKAIEKSVAQSEDDNWMKTVSMFVLNTFFVAVYDGKQDFYSQFEERMEATEKVLRK